MSSSSISEQIANDGMFVSQQKIIKSGQVQLFYTPKIKKDFALSLFSKFIEQLQDNSKLCATLYSINNLLKLFPKLVTQISPDLLEDFLKISITELNCKIPNLVMHIFATILKIDKHFAETFLNINYQSINTSTFLLSQLPNKYAVFCLLVIASEVSLFKNNLIQMKIQDFLFELLFTCYNNDSSVYSSVIPFLCILLEDENTEIHIEQIKTLMNVIGDHIQSYSNVLINQEKIKILSKEIKLILKLLISIAIREQKDYYKKSDDSNFLNECNIKKPVLEGAIINDICNINQFSNLFLSFISKFQSCEDNYSIKYDIFDWVRQMCVYSLAFALSFSTNCENKEYQIIPDSLTQLSFSPTQFQYYLAYVNNNNDYALQFSQIIITVIEKISPEIRFIDNSFYIFSSPSNKKEEGKSFIDKYVLENESMIQTIIFNWLQGTVKLQIAAVNLISHLLSYSTFIEKFTENYQKISPNPFLETINDILNTDSKIAVSYLKSLFNILTHRDSLSATSCQYLYQYCQNPDFYEFLLSLIDDDSGNVSISASQLLQECESENLFKKI